jgi:hypothetical protein
MAAFWVEMGVAYWLFRNPNKFKLDAIKQHESSKPHQYYQSRYNRTSQTQLNLFISVVDLNLGIFLLKTVLPICIY